MMMHSFGMGPMLEMKFCGFGPDGAQENADTICGYASRFGDPDQGGDCVDQGAYANSLLVLQRAGRKVKMLWQHDPTRPIGVWDEVREDETGLFVKGRILTDVSAGAEALSLIRAGAIDGLSIGYRTKRAEKTAQGRRLQEIDLWEISLVTFPMLPSARLSPGPDAQKSDDHEMALALRQAFQHARADLPRG